MAVENQSEPKLTKNQNLVFGKLNNSGGPLSAYALLEVLRSEGLRAPLQVYRALDKLIVLGLVHRLESLSAFVACQHPNCDQFSASAFFICERCGDVNELSNAHLGGFLKELGNEDGFDMKSSTVELRGNCRKCKLPD